jgi:transketolase
MAALMKQPVIFVYTHDSIGLGEDGPTHQPVEQLANLRSTPNLHTWRPCDVAESAVAWKNALERRDGPSALIFTRQNLPHQARDAKQLADIERGAYVLHDCAGHPEVILIATGSEVALAMAAAEQLALNGRHARVVSMPCTTLFDQQDAGYRESVLPSDVFARVAIEAAHKDFWFKYVGLDGAIVGMETFGESAPIAPLMEYFGFTVEAVVDTVNDLLDN